MPYIGQDLQVAYPTYLNIDDISGSFDGVTTSFSLLVSGSAPVPLPLNSQQCLISVGGVIQRPDDSGTEGFRLSGGNIIFSSAPNTGEDFFGVILAGADYVNVGANFPDGSQAAPSITFEQDNDTGFYRSGSGLVSVSSNNTKVFTFPSTAGSNGQYLQTDGAGTATWASVASDKISEGNTEAEVVDTGSNGHFKVTTEGSERLRVDPSGRLLVGTTSSRNDFFNDTATVAGGIQLELSASDNLNRFMSFVSNNSDTGGPCLIFGKSRGTSANSKTVVQADDTIAQLSFQAADGSDMVPAAQISAAIDGTPGANDMPGRLVFSTTADSASTPSERWRIDKNGLLHNSSGQHAHGSVNFSSDYKCQFGIFGSAEGGTNGSAAVGSGPFDSTYKNSEWASKTLTYGMVNELVGEYNLSQASRCNIGAHFYVINSGGGDYSFPTGGSGSGYWTPNGSAIWATADGHGGYVGYAAIRADVQSYYSSGAAFYARVKDGVTSGVGYGYHCDLGGHPFGGRQAGFYVRQMNTLNETGNAGYVYKRHNTSATLWVMQVENGAGNTIGGITCTNTNTAFPTSSDYRLKENVVPLTGAIDRLKQIPVHRFNFTASPEITQDGFLAHELQPVVPLAVSGTKDEVKSLPKKDENGSFVYDEVDGEKIPVMEEVPEYQTVDYSKVVPLLTAALQEALAEIETLKSRLDAAGL